MMYRDQYIMVAYHPAEDRYRFSFRLVGANHITKWSLEQSLIDEFSRNDINHLSSKLWLINPEFYQDLSRSDVRRIHHAIKGTMENYMKELRKFREKQGL